MRLDCRYHALRAFHDLGKIEFHRRGLHAELARAACMRQELGRADQRFGRHATGIQAVAAHLVFFNQGDFGFYGGCNISSYEARRAGADDDDITVKARGFPPLCINLARLDGIHYPFGDERENAEQGECDDQRRGEYAAQRVDFSDLRSGENVDNGAGQHTKLADPVISPRSDRCESHHEIDDKKRKRGHQAQREQVERPVFCDARVDRGKLVAEPALHRIAQHEVRHQEGECSAKR